MKRLSLFFIAVLTASVLEAATEDVWSTATSLGPNDYYVILKIPVIADEEKIWKTLTDYNHLANFIPYIQQSDVINRKNNWVRLHQAGRIHYWFHTANLEAVFKVIESPGKGISFTCISGNFETLKGSWHIETITPEKSQLICRFEVIPKPSFPSWAVLHVATHQVAEMVEALKHEIERQ
jgi:ribosome-associated toxin RatA of RatAB toxin-antitoxin module